MVCGGSSAGLSLRTYVGCQPPVTMAGPGAIHFRVAMDVASEWHFSGESRYEKVSIFIVQST